MSALAPRYASVFAGVALMVAGTVTLIVKIPRLKTTSGAVVVAVPPEGTGAKPAEAGKTPKRRLSVPPIPRTLMDELADNANAAVDDAGGDRSGSLSDADKPQASAATARRSELSAEGAPAGAAAASRTMFRDADQIVAGRAKHDSYFSSTDSSSPKPRLLALRAPNATQEAALNQQGFVAGGRGLAVLMRRWLEGLTQGDVIVRRCGAPAAEGSSILYGALRAAQTTGVPACFDVLREGALVEGVRVKVPGGADL